MWTILTRDSSCISGTLKTSVLPFSAKNTTVTAYLLELTLARFKKFRLLFYNYCVFVRVQVKDENRLLPLSLLFTGVFPVLGREQKVHIQPKLSRLI